METFHWKVRPDMNVVSEAESGDSEAGRWLGTASCGGTEYQLSTYSVTIRVRKGEHPSLKAFWNGTVASAHFSGRHLMTGN